MNNNNSNFKIAQVLPSMQSGGVERGTLEIANYLANKEIKNFIISSGGRMLDGFKAKNITILPLNTKSKNPLVILYNAYAITRLVKKHNIDILHARSRAPAWSCYIAAMFCKAKYMATFHGTYGTKSAIKRFYNSVMLRGKRVIAISQFINEHIKTYYKADINKVTIIPRGVDLNKFSLDKITRQEQANLIAKWNVSTDQPVILLPGRITYWKGQKELVQALAKINSKANFQCLIVGDSKEGDSYLKEVVAEIEKNNLQNRVSILPATSDMPTALSLADIVISGATVPEAFGRVAIEAQAMGCLTICTKHGGSIENTIDNVSGFHVKPNDIDDLAEKILHCLNLPKIEQDKIKLAAQKNAAEFSTEKMCASTLQVYIELSKS